MQSWQERDLKNIWHPCSQMKDYETFKPIIIKSGSGVWLEDMNGKKYIDAVSSWWVNLFGHSNPRINEALKNQVDKLEHVIFANFSHQPAIELAEEIIKVTPKPLQKVFFCDNGSSAIEVSMKLSFQYHQQIGKTKKTRFVALSNAYHGETIGALSIGDVSLYNEIYKPLLLNKFVAKGPDCFRCEYGDTRENCSGQCFEHMQKLVEEKHDEITAIIVEPIVQCAAGMMIYPPVYLQKLRKLCDDYDINLIADEIAVGFGRTGKMFACEHANISPDIMAVSKGLTAGYMPLALSLMTNKIYDAFYDDYETMKAFLHSHSYSGNPLGCSIAVETLKIFKEENIINNNIEKSNMIRNKILNIVDDIPYFGEFRQIGMIGAIELVKDKNTKEGFDWKERVGYNIYKKALDRGVLLRPLGNIIYFMPPYVINEKEIDILVNTARDCTIEYFKER